MGSHARPVLAKRGHYQVAQAEFGDTRRSWVVFLLVRKVLLKRLMVGVLTWSVDLMTDYLPAGCCPSLSL